MSWTCAACATTNEDAADACIVCQTARSSMASGSSGVPLVPVVGASRAPASAGASPASRTPNAPLPPTGWSGATTPTPGPSGRIPWVAIAVIAAVAALGIGVGIVLSGGGDDEVASTGNAQTSEPSPDGVQASSATEEADVTFEEETTSAPPTTTPPTTVPPTTPTTIATPPGLDVLPYDRWVTVLYSRAKGEYSLDQVLAEAEQVASRQGGDSRVRVVDSDASMHMRSGFWAIILVDFGSREEAIGWCDEFGIPKGPCNPLQTLTGQR